MRIFGSQVTFKNNRKPKKFESRAYQGIFLGFQDENYRVYNLEKDIVEISCEVTFYEELEIDRNLRTLEIIESEDKNILDDNNSDDNDSDDNLENDENDLELNELIEIEDSSSEDRSLDLPDPEKEIIIPEEPFEFFDYNNNNYQLEGGLENEKVRKFKKDDKIFLECKLPSEKLCYYPGTIIEVNDKSYKVHCDDNDEYSDVLSEELELKDKIESEDENEALNIFTEEKEPNTYEEAMKSECWKKAIDEELNSLKSNNTWSKPTEVPRNQRQIINSKFIFKIKRSPEGKVDRYKARLVAQGFTQIKGINYEDTYSPVVRKETLRFLINYATENNLMIHHMDVDTAFLNSKLDEEIFIKLPINGEVVQLNKALYGLKQSPYLWNKEISSYLLSKGFTQATADNCVFVRTIKGHLQILAIYVDDCVLIGNEENILDMKKILNSKYKMKDLGELTYIIGIEVERTKDHTKIHQSSYILEVLKEFNMLDCKPVVTPSTNNQDEDNIKFDQVTYMKAVGMLNYLATCTRPDLSYAVSKVSRKMQAPVKSDWMDVKRILRYLRGTLNYKLVYTTKETPMYGFSDADYASEKDRKSISGYTFIKNGGAICWSSKKQTVVALSSMESELIALTEAVKQGLWLRKLCSDLGVSYKVKIFEDNQSTIASVKGNTTFSSRAKHIDVRYQFVQDRVEKDEVFIEYLCSEEMTADVFTKALKKNLHQRHTIGLGLIGEEY